MPLFQSYTSFIPNYFVLLILFCIGPKLHFQEVEQVDALSTAEAM